MEGIDLLGLSETLFQGFSIDREAMIDAILSGNILSALELLWNAILKSVGSPIVNLKNYFIVFLVIGISAIVLKQLHHLFENSQIQKTCFWMIYLLLAKNLLVLFYDCQEVARGCLDKLLKFGQVFVPAFSAVLTMASGRLTGTGYIATFTLAIYMIEQFLLYVMLPVIEAYMLLSILGGVWQKDRVEHILKLIEKGVSIGLKGTFAIVTGIGLLQSMILPFVDNAKVGAAKKIVNLIPGVGNVSATTLEMITGSAILLKNGVGVIGILLLLVVCAAPLIKVGLVCLTMKVTTIIYGLLDEKNMTWCVDKLCLSQVFLMKIIAVGLALFLVWIMLAVSTTNQRLWT